jgi:hypothetical protein
LAGDGTLRFSLASPLQRQWTYVWTVSLGMRAVEHVIPAVARWPRGISFVGYKGKPQEMKSCFFLFSISVFTSTNQLIHITMHFSTLLTSVALAASFVAAHPGHDISQEIREREIALRSLPPNLAHCAEKMRKRGITAEAGKRRALLAKFAREERGLNVGRQHGINPRIILAS